MRRFDPEKLGLYVLTSGTHGRSHRRIALAAIEGGATTVQLRAPQIGEDELLALARELATACREAGVMFIVNDRVDVCLASGADGVHLGQGDDPMGARQRLGPVPVLGVSVDDPGQAQTVSGGGADYVAVTVWSTPTKSEAVPHGLEGLAEIASRSALPVVGIGGIGVQNARAVLEAGAAGVAVISAVAGAADPVAATRALREAIDGYRAGGGAEA